jgi:hypothetical protein
MLSANKPPVWKQQSFVQKNATVGKAYSTYVNFRVSDPEEDGLVYAKVSGPDWSQLTNPTYGRFEGTPTAQQLGEHRVQVTVSDGINPPVEATMRVIVEVAP